ncbi:MAG: ABC transporter permease subunit [Treponema sp.]|nr:ABC transporter permease subunit [Treponema sp.]
MSDVVIKPQRLKMDPRKRQGYIMFLMILPLLSLVFLFQYFPLHGLIYAFYDYRPPFRLFDTDFVGFRWFTTLVANASRRRQILEVLTNTFAMSGLSILFSWLPMAFAILLNIISNRPYKRVVQTLTTLPNFISWVLVYSMAFFIFSSTGFVNTLAIRLGIYENPILFLQSGDNVWITMWLWGTWKGLGWSAILYIAAIAGIDQELYEAAYVDGAGRFRVVWHVTIPGLLPTYFVLLLLNIASFLSNGFEQFFVFSNPFNLQRIQVLDLFVYNLGIGQGNYSLAVAISLMRSLISLTLLFTVNRLSKLLRGETII